MVILYFCAFNFKRNFLNITKWLVPTYERFCLLIFVAEYGVKGCFLGTLSVCSQQQLTLCQATFSQIPAICSPSLLDVSPHHPYKLLIFLSPASAVSMCSCSLLFGYYYTLRPELPLGNGKALHQILCKNPLNPTQVLRKCSCQTPEHTAATRLQQKRHF